MLNVCCPRLIVLVALGLLSFNLVGCGTNTTQVVEHEPTVVPTPVETVRQSLLDVANSGEFNSGTPLIKDELEKLRGDESVQVDVDSLQKEVDDLLKLTNRMQIQTKARQLVEKLPS
jgi:hypothetical protein